MPESIEAILRKYWGFDQFLPLQKQATECVCRGRDSIVVLPTGGGKSLFFQVTALKFGRQNIPIHRIDAGFSTRLSTLHHFSFGFVHFFWNLLKA
jgi:hypothetical protein